MSASRADPPGLRRVLVLLGAFFVLVQVNRSAGGVLAGHFGHERGMAATDIGTVMGAMFFGAAAAQLPTGVMMDWLGPRRTLVWLGLVAISGIVVFALAPGTSGLIAGRFAIGLGHGGVITGIYLIAMAWTAPERTAQAAAAVVGIAGGIGGILATTPLALALTAFGFAPSFLGLAAATGVVTLMLLAMLPDRPPDAAGVAHRPAETLGQTLVGLGQVMRMPELRRIFVMGSCFSAPFMTIGGLWAGPYFSRIQGLAPETASLVLLGLVVALHAGTWGYGVLERRVGGRRRLILCGVAVQVVALAPLVAWPTLPWLAATVAMAVFGCAAPIFVVLAGHARAFVPPGRAGRAMTCISLVGLTGVFLLQGLTGALLDLADRLGAAPETGFRLVFLAVILALAAAALAYRTQPEAPERW